MSNDLEKKTVFGLGEIDGDPLIVLGIPAGAWEFIKKGNCNTFDFSKAGLKVKLVIFGGESHAEVMDLMQSAVKVSNFDEPNLKPDLDTDFSIAEKKPN